MQPMQPLRSRVWLRFIGRMLIGTALLGMLISLFGIVFVLYTGAVATQALNHQLETLDEALVVTQEGFGVADVMLGDTQRTLYSLSSTVSSTSRTITDIDPTLAALGDLTRDSLPETIAATRQTLNAASESARIADGVLGALGFFGLRYEPEVPLNVAIIQVSDSLESLPLALAEVTQGIETTQENLGTIAGDLEQVAVGLDAIALNLGETATVVTQYDAIVTELRIELAAVRESAPRWLLAGQFGLILLLIWLGLAQIGLFVQGKQLLAESPYV